MNNIKITVGIDGSTRFYLIPQKLVADAAVELAYRMPALVTEIVMFPSSYSEVTGYYVCPRCGITLDREFMGFCDRCGQRLDWKGYKRVKRRPAGRGR